MFNTKKEFNPDHLIQEATRLKQGYPIQKNDYLNIWMFSNKGEQLVTHNNLSNDQMNSNRPQYIVSSEGHVRIPLIGEVFLEGMTLFEAEQMLQEKCKIFFEEPYVMIRFTNKRAVLLGGVESQVIPLTNLDMKLTEVLALGKGVKKNSKVCNIKVFRNDKIFIIDLSSAEKYIANDIIIEPGDIIYVEPIIRSVREFSIGYGGILSSLVGLASLTISIISLTR